MINEYSLQNINFYADENVKKDLQDILVDIDLKTIEDNSEEKLFNILFYKKGDYTKYYSSEPNTLSLVIQEDSLLGQMESIEGPNVFELSRKFSAEEIDQIINIYFSPLFMGVKSDCLRLGQKRTQGYLRALSDEKLKDKTVKKLIDLERKLYCALNRDEMVTVFKEFLNETIEGDFSLFRDYEKGYKLDPEDILAFNYDDECFYLSFKPSDKNIMYTMISILCISNLLSLESEEGLLETTNKELNWSYVYDSLPIPSVLIDSFGSIRKYNKLFLDMTLTSTQCSSFSDDQDVSIKGSIYKVRRIDGVDNEMSLLYFFKDSYISSEEILPSNEELGIISSSLAHELNNPLGGILAAINLLELDEHPDEILDQLSDMRKSAQRCKELVETFLGFSRAMPQNFHSENNVLDQLSLSKIKQAFGQANDLVRFRLIENNLMMNFSLAQEDSFEYEVNPSIWAMIIYLIYGDIITNLQHLKLVDDSLRSIKTIATNLIERKREVLLCFDIPHIVDEINIEEGLLVHLLDNEKLNIVKNSDSVLIAPKGVSLEI
jgi:hypothetical protein